MFAPLTAASASSQQQQWQPILPVPADAPPPPQRHPKLGLPARSWEYRDAAGTLLGLVHRFDVKGGKEIRTLVYAEHAKYGREWRWLGFPRPRPLFNLHHLALRPDAPVVVTEGELAADAAAQLLRGYVVITSPGGAKAAKAADWSVLIDRREVTLWPDQDEPGQAYARSVIAMLQGAGVTGAIRVIKPPPGAAKGYDAADALAEGRNTAWAAELIAGAETIATTSGVPSHKPARDAILSALQDAGAEYWHSADQQSFMTVLDDSRVRHFEIGSRGCKSWLSWHVNKTAGFSPAAATIEDALRVCEGFALYQSPCFLVSRRTAEHQGVIYVDLGDRTGRAVAIRPGGWKIVSAVPREIKFLRSKGMLALPEPEAGGTIGLLREFVNLETDDDFMLLLAWLAAALRPRGPFPVLVIEGPPGAAKSSLVRRSEPAGTSQLTAR
jgi:putative DNA primase/helicase